MTKKVEKLGPSRKKNDKKVEKAKAVKVLESILLANSPQHHIQIIGKRRGSTFLISSYLPELLISKLDKKESMK